MKGINQCPICGSSRICNISEEGLRIDIGQSPVIYMACLDCPAENPTVWEQVKRENLAVPTNPLSMFKACCDNCAFRPSSPERSDPEKWEYLMREFSYRDATFYCHKGVPLDFDRNTSQSHRHPYDEEGNLKRDEARVCAGWAAWKLRAIWESELSDESL